MSRAVIRLGRHHRGLLLAGFGGVWASGALWLLFHYFFQVEGEFGPRHHALEIWWLRLHGLGAMLALILLGSLAPNHIHLAWTRRKHLRSGLPMLGGWLWLAGTGYALYYFSGDDSTAWLPLMHWGVGLGLPALLALHLKQAFRRSARSVSAPTLHAATAARPISQPASRSARS